MSKPSIFVKHQHFNKNKIEKNTQQKYKTKLSSELIVNHENKNTQPINIYTLISQK